MSVEVWVNGHGRYVPRHTLTRYETLEVLGVPDDKSVVVAFEDGTRLSFTDGWDFRDGQRFVTIYRAGP